MCVVVHTGHCALAVLSRGGIYINETSISNSACLHILGFGDAYLRAGNAAVNMCDCYCAETPTYVGHKLHYAKRNPPWQGEPLLLGGTVRALQLGMYIFHSIDVHLEWTDGERTVTGKPDDLIVETISISRGPLRTYVLEDSATDSSVEIESAGTHFRVLCAIVVLMRRAFYTGQSKYFFSAARRVDVVSWVERDPLVKYH